MSESILAHDLDMINNRGIALLSLNEDDWESYQSSRTCGHHFSRAMSHGLASEAKPKSLALIRIKQSDLLMVALVRSRRAVTTLESAVKFDLISTISPASFTSLISDIKESSLKASVKRLMESQSEFIKFSPKLGRRILEVISVPENAHALNRILWEVRPKQIENARALQSDALKLALRAFGANEAQELQLFEGQETGLVTVRLQEDAVIEHDARWMPGWELEQSAVTGKAVFVNGDEKLQVITANKRPLEELMGVDLIYLNEKQSSLVLVQYKMMEPEEKRRIPDIDYLQYEEKEWTVRIDEQFKSEIVRMRKFDRDLDQKGPYRLNPGAFFFKLVKRYSQIESSGIILSLDHFDQLLENGALDGPKGGLRLRYSDLNGHYVRSDGLIELIRSGYIGTRGATTTHLQALIDAALSEGRAAVAAIQSKLPPDEDYRRPPHPIDRAFKPLSAMPINWNEDHPGDEDEEVDENLNF